MSAPQKRLRPTTYSHRQALARMRKQPGLVMQCAALIDVLYRWHEGKLQICSKPWWPRWLDYDTVCVVSPQEKAARWFDAIPQPK